MKPAGMADLDTVSGILAEAASWLEHEGIPLWRTGELSAETIREDVQSGLFVLARCDGEAAGTMKYQLEDKVFWSDVAGDDAAFVHRVAVRRRYAGDMVSGTLLQWALERTKALGRRYVRLDCEAARPKLRGVYEQFGFRYHSDKSAGPYHVARYEYDVFAGEEKGPQ